MTDHITNVAQSVQVRQCAMPRCDLIGLSIAIHNARELYLDAIGTPNEAGYKLALEQTLWNDKGSFAPALKELADWRASQPSPAATVETATSSDGGGESRPASTEPQASALRRPQGLIGEAGVAPSPSDSHPSSSAGNGELRKLQEIIDNQADQILDLHDVLKSAYLLNEFIAGAYVLSLADFRYLNVVSTKIKAALPGGDVTPDEPQGARK